METRWVPSRDYHRRQAEIREANCRLRGSGHREDLELPPFQYYAERADMVPVRIQPSPAPKRRRYERRAFVGGPPTDLSDLEAEARLHRARVIYPGAQ
jgi:hypothetical protein